LEALLDDIMGLLALEMDDKTDAAGVVFEGGVIQPLFDRANSLSS
jgi:hypothetical protein